MQPISTAARSIARCRFKQAPSDSFSQAPERGFIGARRIDLIDDSLGLLFFFVSFLRKRRTRARRRAHFVRRSAPRRCFRGASELCTLLPRTTTNAFNPLTAPIARRTRIFTAKVRSSRLIRVWNGGAARRTRRSAPIAVTRWNYCAHHPVHVIHRCPYGWVCEKACTRIERDSINRRCIGYRYPSRHFTASSYVACTPRTNAESYKRILRVLITSRR